MRQNHVLRSRCENIFIESVLLLFDRNRELQCSHLHFVDVNFSLIVLNQQHFFKTFQVRQRTPFRQINFSDDLFRYDFSDDDFEFFGYGEFPAISVVSEDCDVLNYFFGLPEVFQKLLLVDIEKLDVQVSRALHDNIPLIVRSLHVPNFVETRIDGADQLEVVVVVAVQLVRVLAQDQQEVFGVQGADLRRRHFQLFQTFDLGALLVDLPNLRDGIGLVSSAVEEDRFVFLTECQFVTRDLARGRLVKHRHKLLVQ